MFDSNNLYITKGISSEVNLELQLILWQCIEELKKTNINLDYLQIFRLSIDTINGKQIQRIIHEQEQPPYKKEYTIFIDNPLNLKIFVIDDTTHSTMLLASEY